LKATNAVIRCISTHTELKTMHYVRIKLQPDLCHWDTITKAQKKDRKPIHIHIRKPFGNYWTAPEF